MLEFIRNLTFYYCKKYSIDTVIYIAYLTILWFKDTTRKKLLSVLLSHIFTTRTRTRRMQMIVMMFCFLRAEHQKCLFVKYLRAFITFDAELVLSVFFTSPLLRLNPCFYYLVNGELSDLYGSSYKTTWHLC